VADRPGGLHRCLRPGQPTDQAQIERTHRTLDTFTGIPDGLPDLATLQQRLDAEWAQYNRWFPSLASDCGGRPPLLAHPELGQVRRPYRPEWELQLFSEQPVSDELATLELERKVSAVGQIQLAGHSRSVGRATAGQTVQVRCDPLARICIWVIRTEDGTAIAQLPKEGVDVITLTGLSDEPDPDAADPAHVPVFRRISRGTI
jgi:hypothetical protein